jgi:hypothetical protein
LTAKPAFRGPHLPALLAGVGLLWALVAALDPTRPTGSLGGPMLCALALLLRRRRGESTRSYLFATTLAAALAVGVYAHPEFRRGDFRSYYVFLRSAAFDHDLDFTNEYETWRLPMPILTPTGHRRNIQTVGPALLWSPFFGMAHVYVLLDRWVGAARWAPDGNSAPYLRSALAGTVTAVVIASWLLVSVLRRRLPPRLAVVAAVAAITTSPLLIYAFAEPGQAHGPAFSLACLGLWALDRAAERPSLRAWILVGAVSGLIVLVRLQALVFCLAALPLAVSGLAKRTLRPLWLAAATAAALLAVTPQLAAWKVLYGSWFTAGGGLSHWSEETGRAGDVIFRPGQYLDPSSPYLWHVLFSADHGLFSWTPGLLLAAVALVAGLRRWGALGAGGLLVLAATAWFNGSYTVWWSGGDSFGARRFDIVIPFLALGYGTLLLFVSRRQIIAPTVLVAILTVWNMGLARLWREGALGDAVSFEDVAQLQARQVRQEASHWLGVFLGPPGRALAYSYFEGTYFFWNAAKGGIVDMSRSDAPFLTGRWSAPLNDAGPTEYRLAMAPRACVRVPLVRPVDLEARITARAPIRRAAPVMTMTINDAAVGTFALGPEWSESLARLPSSRMVAGENVLCLEFQDAVSGADGERLGARVSRIVIH